MPSYAVFAAPVLLALLILLLLWRAGRGMTAIDSDNDE